MLDKKAYNLKLSRELSAVASLREHLFALVNPIAEAMKQPPCKQFYVVPPIVSYVIQLNEIAIPPTGPGSPWR